MQSRMRRLRQDRLSGRDPEQTHLGRGCALCRGGMWGAGRLDGDKEMHDRSVCREGIYDKAVAAIKLAKEKGFRVTINCTIFNNAEAERVADFFDTVTAMGLDGITMSPGYAYERAPDQKHFLNRHATRE